jgi:hypothetical protein
MKPFRILPLCLALLPCAAAASDFKPTDLAALGAASVAKEACSAVFVSERAKRAIISRSLRNSGCCPKIARASPT